MERERKGTTAAALGDAARTASRFCIEVGGRAPPSASTPMRHAHPVADAPATRLRYRRRAKKPLAEGGYLIKERVC